jgi:tetratricopeptide (TPR) repeat protein
MKGNFPRARQLFRAAYEAALSLGEIETQAIAVCNEGILLLSMEHFDSARNTLEKARDLAAKIDDEHRRDEINCEIYAGLATAYLKTRQPDKAWDSALAAYDGAKRAGEPLLMGFAQRSIGETLTRTETLPADVPRGFEDDPDEYYRASTEAFQAVKAEGEVARTMYSHAMSLAVRGRSMMAARKLQQAMIIFTRLGMADDAAKAAHAQMDVLATTGR